MALRLDNGNRFRLVLLRQIHSATERIVVVAVVVVPLVDHIVVAVTAGAVLRRGLHLQPDFGAVLLVPRLRVLQVVLLNQAVQEGERALVVCMLSCLLMH